MAHFWTVILFALLSSIGSWCHHMMSRAHDRFPFLRKFYAEVWCKCPCAEHPTAPAKVSLWHPWHLSFNLKIIFTPWLCTILSALISLFVKGSQTQKAYSSCERHIELYALSLVLSGAQLSSTNGVIGYVIGKLQTAVWLPSICNDLCALALYYSKSSLGLLEGNRLALIGIETHLQCLGPDV